jgi:hypothetical protein
VCRSVKFLSVTIKKVNKRRSILQISPLFTYQIISFDANLHALCFSSLNFVKFIVKFKKFEHFIFLILFYFFTGTMHVKKNCYLCCACTNEICFYSASDNTEIKFSETNKSRWEDNYIKIPI